MFTCWASFLSPFSFARYYFRLPLAFAFFSGLDPCLCLPDSSKQTRPKLDVCQPPPRLDTGRSAQEIHDTHSASQQGKANTAFAYPPRHLPPSRLRHVPRRQQLHLGHQAQSLRPTILRLHRLRPEPDLVSGLSEQKREKKLESRIEKPKG